MKTIAPLLYACGFAAAAGGISTSLHAAEKAPNFILLYVDDLGWADTSVRMRESDPESGSDFHQTPHLEKLAARGMKFSNGYAPAPTCTPSRKSIQFGKTPARLQYTFVHDVLSMERGLKYGEETSMADVLKESGKNYVTAHFGKGMGGERMETIGYDVTDEYDIGDNGNFHGEYVDLKSRKPLPADDPKRLVSLTERSVNFVKENAGERPFFLMVSHYAVHVPHAASAEVIEKYRQLPRGKYLKDEDYLDPTKMRESFKTSSWRLQYAAMVEQVDTNLGLVVEALEAKGELDNTYIIFTSDNGGGLSPNGSLAKGKGTLYEGGLRVPWVIAGPGVKAGAQCDVPVVQWDLLPTLHDLSGSTAAMPSDLDGGSLREVLRRGNEGQVERPVEGLVFHYPCNFAPPLSVIRLGDYKYMKHLLTGAGKLFNVKEDSAEKHDVATAIPEKVVELDAALTRYLAQVDAEDVQDVYRARFAELDEFEKRARETQAKAVERAKGDPAGIVKANAKLAEDLERFAKNRQECRENMQGTEF